MNFLSALGRSFENIKFTIDASLISLFDLTMRADSYVIYGELDVFRSSCPRRRKGIITGVVFTKSVPVSFRKSRVQLGEWLFEYHFPDPLP